MDGFWVLATLLIAAIVAFIWWSMRAHRTSRAATAQMNATNLATLQNLRAALIQEHGPDLGEALWEREVMHYNLSVQTMNAARRASGPRMVIGPFVTGA